MAALPFNCKRAGEEPAKPVLKLIAGETLEVVADAVLENFELPIPLKP